MQPRVQIFFLLYFILSFYLSPQPASLPLSPPTPLLSDHKLDRNCLVVVFYCFNLDIFAGIADSTIVVVVFYYDLRDDKLLPLSLQAILLQQHLQYESLK